MGLAADYSQRGDASCWEATDCVVVKVAHRRSFKGERNLKLQLSYNFYSFVLQERYGNSYEELNIRSVNNDP